MTDINQITLLTQGDSTQPTDRDFRIDYYIDASVYWHGRGKVVHLSTGYVEYFEIAWNNRADLHRAKERILKRILYTTNEKMT